MDSPLESCASEATVLAGSGTRRVQAGDLHPLAAGARDHDSGDLVPFLYDFNGAARPGSTSVVGRGSDGFRRVDRDGPLVRTKGRHRDGLFAVKEGFHDLDAVDAAIAVDCSASAASPWSVLDESVRLRVTRWFESDPRASFGSGFVSA